jgi:hypothetical protein
MPEQNENEEIARRKLARLDSFANGADALTTAMAAQAHATLAVLEALRELKDRK